MKNINTKKGLSSLGLKYIALITMTIDHSGLMLLDYSSIAYTIARGIGRIAFPLYCFLLVEGFFHTRNRHAYLKRLLLFAFLSEIPFDMALFQFPHVTDLSILMQHQNVYFTLAFGFLAMLCMEKYRYQNPIVRLCFGIAFAVLAEFMNTDYGAIGVMVIFLLYYYRTNMAYMPSPLIGTLFPILALLGYGNYCVLLSVPLIYFYNGEKGNTSFPNLKYLFYVYYPIHLLVLVFLKNFL